jgi:hypothetical protein
MNTGMEDFEKLRKLLKLKRHEQPPPGYFNRFSGLVINRIEKEVETGGDWLEAPWLRKLLRTFETSPMVAGLFGATVCGVVIFGITAANQTSKGPAAAFTPMASAAVDVGTRASQVMNVDLHSLGRSTDAMFGSSMMGSPFGGNNGMTASVEPVTFTTSHP